MDSTFSNQQKALWSPPQYRTHSYEFRELQLIPEAYTEGALVA